MGTSVKRIDETYGQLARDSEATILARLNARAARPGVDVASAENSELARNPHSPHAPRAAAAGDYPSGRLRMNAPGAAGRGRSRAGRNGRSHAGSRASGTSSQAEPRPA
jgi:hypothetical protein